MGPVAGSCFKRKVYITGHLRVRCLRYQKTYSFDPFEQEGNVEFTMVFIRFLYDVADVQLSSVCCHIALDTQSVVQR